MSPVPPGARLEGENVLARFMLTNYQQHHHRPLYEVLVERAWRQGMAGATVLKGLAGFLLDGPLLVRHPWKPSNELPVVVELVDGARAMSGFLPGVAPLVKHGLLTLERARVIYYRASERPRDLGRQAPRVQGAEAWEVLAMDLPEEGTLLRIFVDDCDRDPGSGLLLYDRLVRVAHERGMAGATVLRGTMGFGRHSVVRAARLIDTPLDMPVVIEVVDEEAKIQQYLAAIDPLIPEGLVTLEKVRVHKYRSRES